MNNNEQNPNRSQGQQGSDSEIERRNRENESGQTGQSQRDPAGGKEFGQQSQKDTTLTKPTDETTKKDKDDQSGFLGTSKEDSSDYLTKGDKQNFAEQGQGAQDSNAGEFDIETGKPKNRDARFDDGSDADR